MKLFTLSSIGRFYLIYGGRAAGAEICGFAYSTISGRRGRKWRFTDSYSRRRQGICDQSSVGGVTNDST